MERRLHDRIALKTPISCTFRIGEEEPVHGVVRNVGVMGVMVEIPDLTDHLTMECCQRVTIDEGGSGNGNSHLFTGMVGVLSWVYKNYIGVGFEYPIRATHEELVQWLEEHDQICDDLC